MLTKLEEEVIELARKNGMQFVTLSKVPKIPEETLGFMGIERAIRHRAIPINFDQENNMVTVAIDDPTDTENMEQIRIILSPKNVAFYLATVPDLQNALKVRYSEKLVGSGN